MSKRVLGISVVLVRYKVVIRPFLIISVVLGLFLFTPYCYAADVDIVPSGQVGNDTGDTLSGVTGDDSTTENPDELSAVNTGDNVYTVDAGKIMLFSSFDVSSICAIYKAGGIIISSRRYSEELRD